MSVLLELFDIRNVNYKRIILWSAFCSKNFLHRSRIFRVGSKTVYSFGRHTNYLSARKKSSRIPKLLLGRAQKFCIEVHRLCVLLRKLRRKLRRLIGSGESVDHLVQITV